MQDVYDKKVLHRLAGVPSRTTVTQDASHTNGIVHSNGGGASIVQTAWEPKRSHETDDDEHGRRPESSTKVLSQEVIDMDADEEESRYGIPRKLRRRINEVVDAEMIFTTDSGSESSEVIVIGTSEEGEVVEEGERRGKETGKGLRVKINRKRAFWASKAGTAGAETETGTGARAGLGTGTSVA